MSTAVTGFPGILAPVTVHLSLPDGAGVDLSSWVCDVEDVAGVRRVVVGRPDLSGVEDAGTFPRRGEELSLQWAQPTGRMQLPVTAETASRPYGPVWLLTPVAAPTREQRREYFRVPLTAPAVLTPVVDDATDDSAEHADEGAEARPVRARLVDISEGGALLSCDGDLPEPGTRVELSFTLQDKPITAAAEVVRHVAQPTGRPCAAVRFLDPAAYGDHIRRVAFDLQRSQARARRD